MDVLKKDLLSLTTEEATSLEGILVAGAKASSFAELGMAAIGNYLRFITKEFKKSFSDLGVCFGKAMA